MTIIAGRSGSNFATYQEVISQPLPQKTRSYVPISNRDLIGLVEHKAKEITGMEVSNRQYVLGAKGAQMFGSVTLKSNDEDRNVLLGFANSYDKSLSIRIVSGASIMVCSNMCISGSDFTSSRKHTTNMSGEIEGLVHAAVSAATDNYANIASTLDEWKTREVSWERGAEILGLSFFEGIMSPRQTSIAVTDWRNAKNGKPRHQEFKDPTVYSLYNAVTEGLKNGPASSVSDRYREAHRWVEQLVAA